MKTETIETKISSDWKEHLKKIGLKGAASTSKKKTDASRLNGKKGGRHKNVYIYGILNGATGTIEYVGQSKDPRQRLQTHKTSSNRVLFNVQFPINLVILAVTDEMHANEVERAAFNHFKSKGQCGLNGKRFCEYWARVPHFLKTGETQAEQRTRLEKEISKTY